VKPRIILKGDEFMLTMIINMIKSNKKGQGMVEYALIIALVAVVLVGALGLLSGQVGEVFGGITTALGGEAAAG